MTEVRRIDPKGKPVRILSGDEVIEAIGVPWGCSGICACTGRCLRRVVEKHDDGTVTVEVDPPPPPPR